MKPFTIDDRLRISTKIYERVRLIEAGTRLLPRADAAWLWMSPRGQYVIAQALALAIWADGRLPPHRREPSDMAIVATLLWSLFPGWAGLVTHQILEHEEIDRLVRTEPQG